ncbi:hypothetical protein L3Y34_014997 [Caenorhabditis briggsae]|uniref:Uncharacterized protein n=1 Tax=Caenorhabditis briggsae TaxID=6238 RepID=A0AAE9DUR7_CAEBR|nr:hypothetical protein L3Y34_014997 [Caenorhabditis briggsae]
MGEMMRNGELTKWRVWDSQEDFEETTIDEDESRDEINLENMEQGIYFSYDVVGVFLPDHLLYGKISENESFLKIISGDPMKEIQRRRDKPENVAETSKSSIGHMLNYLREYHFCLESGKLLNCKKRSTCSPHLTWRDMKSFRDYCRENSRDPDDYDLKDIVGFSKNHSKNNPSSYNGPPILPKSS